MVRLQLRGLHMHPQGLLSLKASKQLPADNSIKQIQKRKISPTHLKALPKPLEYVMLQCKDHVVCKKYMFCNWYNCSFVSFLKYEQKLFKLLQKDFHTSSN
jgi:hypothetical protein